nr:hypothetical protein [Burkholderia cenocepacia]
MLDGLFLAMGLLLDGLRMGMRLRMGGAMRLHALRGRVRGECEQQERQDEDQGGPGARQARDEAGQAKVSFSRAMRLRGMRGRSAGAGNYTVDRAAMTMG